jgi:hypothetical protein
VRVVSHENKNSARETTRAVRDSLRSKNSAAGRHFKPGANVRRDLGGVVVDEMADTMVRDAPQLPQSVGRNHNPILGLDPTQHGFEV